MDNISSLSRVALWRLLPQEYQVYISGSTGRESRHGAKEFWEAIWHFFTILISPIWKYVQYGILLEHFGQR